MLTIELDATAEARLRAEAEARGVPVETYTREILEGILVTSVGQRLVEQWRQDGVIGSRPDITDRDAYASELREKTWERGQE